MGHDFPKKRQKEEEFKSRFKSDKIYKEQEVVESQFAYVLMEYGILKRI